jgi:hypothetical protein
MNLAKLAIAEQFFTLYLLYWHKSFTWFTGTKVQILTQKALAS